MTHEELAQTVKRISEFCNLPVQLGELNGTPTLWIDNHKVETYPSWELAKKALSFFSPQGV